MRLVYSMSLWRPAMLYKKYLLVKLNALINLTGEEISHQIKGWIYIKIVSFLKKLFQNLAFFWHSDYGS